MKIPPLFDGIVEPCSIREFVSMVAGKHKNEIAFSYREKPSDKETIKYTYRQLAYDVKCLGTEVCARGFSGMHIALIGKLSYKWALCYLSFMAVGACVVPLDKDWTAEDLADTVKKADCSVLVCDADLSDKADVICKVAGISAPIILTGKTQGDSIETMLEGGRELVALGDRSYSMARVNPKKLSLLVFTSGTTGKGKGVMLSQKNILSNMADGLKLLRVGKKTIAILPPHHTFGSTIGILAPLYGGANIYISSGIRYVSQEMKSERPDFMVLVPLFLETFYRKIKAAVKEKGLDKNLTRMMKISDKLLKGKMELRRKMFTSVLASFGGNLNMIACGGAPLSSEVYNFFTSLGIETVVGYGITECSPLISANRVGFTADGCAGSPIPSAKVKIDAIGDDGEGEICVTGPNVMLGYYKDEDATEEAFDGDGYFRTGDIGRLDSYGRIFITGRLKNLIILSNGKNVYPEEIENELASIPGILEVVVYEGISARGYEHNAVVAEIYMDPEFIAASDIKNEKEYLAPFIEKYNKNAVPYKKINQVRVRKTDFPKNTLRKIVRFKIDRNID